MTDAHLRQLEREAAQGDLEAQARLLLERVRVGELSHERLKLAAHCGHEASRSALAIFEPPTNPQSPQAMEEWLCGLRDREQEALVRASLVMMRLWMPHLERLNQQVGVWRAALAAGETLLLSASPENEEATRHAFDQAGWQWTDLELRLSYWAEKAVTHEGIATVEQIVSAVSRELVPWALGS